MPMESGLDLEKQSQLRSGRELFFLTSLFIELIEEFERIGMLLFKKQPRR